MLAGQLEGLVGWVVGGGGGGGAGGGGGGGGGGVLGVQYTQLGSTNLRYMIHHCPTASQQMFDIVNLLRNSTRTLNVMDDAVPTKGTS